MPARTFLRFFLVVGFSQITLSACATTEQQTAQSAPVYYSDCGQISLDGKDGRNLTREELIAAEEQALFDALDASSECNKKALNAGQQAVTAAGAASGNSGQSGTGGAGGGSTPQSGSGTVGQDPADANEQQPEQIISSSGGAGGEQSGVNGQEITVCQISQENLAAANTPEDKAFWQAEVDKNCH